MSSGLKKMVIEYEDKLIDEALEKANGNRAEAARILKMKRTTLIQKLKRRENASSHLPD